MSSTYKRIMTIIVPFMAMKNLDIAVHDIFRYTKHVFFFVFYGSCWMLKTFIYSFRNNVFRIISWYQKVKVILKSRVNRKETEEANTADVACWWDRLPTEQWSALRPTAARNGCPIWDCTIERRKQHASVRTLWDRGRETCGNSLSDIVSICTWHHK